MPELTEEALEALAESMREPTPSGGGWGGAGSPVDDLDNPEIPAGYTYFGQFVDHDLTFDPASSLEHMNDPDGLRNFRTPRFDLDSLYGSGPADEPFQYDQNRAGKLLMAERDGQHDLPRNDEGIALIGDPRNDENLIVSGLQLVFLKFHNALFNEVAADRSIPEDRRFEETQQRARWHYQWVVVYDFLRRLIPDETFRALVKAQRRDGRPGPDFVRPNYEIRKHAYMPIEFSVAAYRFGHSQVRPSYDLNSQKKDVPIFVAGEDVAPDADLRGFRERPADIEVDWSLFLEIDGSTPQPSRLIDTQLAEGLFDLPGIPGHEPQSLPLRNLRRGQQFGLPSGQDVARYLQKRQREIAILTDDELGGAPTPTPLWFYVLKEAEVMPSEPAKAGKQLGPVGAQIVGEVLLGLIEADSRSWVNIDPTWEPTIPVAGDTQRDLELADIVKYATAA